MNKLQNIIYRFSYAECTAYLLLLCRSMNEIISLLMTKLYHINVALDRPLHIVFFCPPVQFHTRIWTAYVLRQRFVLTVIHPCNCLQHPVQQHNAYEQPFEVFVILLCIQVLIYSPINHGISHLNHLFKHDLANIKQMSSESRSNERHESC